MCSSISITLEVATNSQTTSIKNGPFTIQNSLPIPNQNLCNTICKTVKNLFEIDMQIPAQTAKIPFYIYENFIVYDSTIIIVSTKSGSIISPISQNSNNWNLVLSSNVIGLALKPQNPQTSEFDIISN